MPAVGGTLICCRDDREEHLRHHRRRGRDPIGGAPMVLNSIIAPAGRPAPSTRCGRGLCASARHNRERWPRSNRSAFGCAISPADRPGHVTECLAAAGTACRKRNAAAIKAHTGVPDVEGIGVHDEGNPVPRDVDAGPDRDPGQFGHEGVPAEDPKATEEAFEAEFFVPATSRPTSGRLHQDHDRAKDIIISGGENVSSVEVEGALMLPWSRFAPWWPTRRDGAMPCAFVELKESQRRCGRADRLCPVAARLQDPQAHRLLRPSQDLDRQGPEVRTSGRARDQTTRRPGLPRRVNDTVEDRGRHQRRQPER